MIDNERIHQATEHRELAGVVPHYLTEAARCGLVSDPNDQRNQEPGDEPNRAESGNAMEDRADHACIVVSRSPSKADAAFIESLSNPLKWHGGKTYLAPWIISHM